LGLPLRARLEAALAQRDGGAEPSGREKMVAGGMLESSSAFAV